MATCCVFVSVPVLYAVYRLTLMAFLTVVWLKHNVNIPVLWSVWYHVNHLLQVPRILNPVVLVVDALPDLCKDMQVRAYVESSFGSVEQCRQAQLLHHLLRMRLCVCVCLCVCYCSGRQSTAALSKNGWICY